jgi:hypothetical protein
MSHQVKLTNITMTDIEILKRAIMDEGLTIDSNGFQGYSRHYAAGTKHQNGTVLFGINIRKGAGRYSNVPCGVTQSEDGKLHIVGDEYGVEYQGEYGLRQLSCNLQQRYGILDTIEAAEASGMGKWNVVEQPEELLKWNSKGKTRLVFEEEAGMAVGALA